MKNTVCHCHGFGKHGVDKKVMSNVTWKLEGGKNLGFVERYASVRAIERGDWEK